MGHLRKKILAKLNVNPILSFEKNPLQINYLNT